MNENPDNVQAVDGRTEDNILEVEHLKKYFPLKKSLTGKVTVCVHAVEDVSFKLKRGSVLGIVSSRAAAKPQWGARF